MGTHEIERMQPSSGKFTAGNLSVQILGARGLTPAVAGSLLKWTTNYANPYVSLCLEKQTYQSEAIHHTLDPIWKESCVFEVPLPKERDLGESCPVLPKWKGDQLVGCRYVAHHPMILVKVFHKTEIDGEKDKCIGFSVVPVTKAIVSVTASCRDWFPIYDKDMKPAGHVHLGMQYEFDDVEPHVGDIIRLAGFGGNRYYTKVLGPCARLEVTELYRDQVLAQCNSPEGWPISFEIPKNLIHVVEHPSILHTAQTKLQAQIIRLQSSGPALKAVDLWHKIPPKRRYQLIQCGFFGLEVGKASWELVHEVSATILNSGVRSGMHEFRTEGILTVRHLQELFYKLDWSGQNARPIAFSRISANNTQHSLNKLPQRLIQDEDGREKRILSEDDNVKSSHALDPNQAEEEEFPSQLLCPITGCPMVDPVVAADGHTYDREAILQWFTTSSMSPMTGLVMPTTRVFPNFTLKIIAEEYQNSKTNMPTS